MKCVSRVVAVVCMSVHTILLLYIHKHIYIYIDTHIHKIHIFVWGVRVI